MITRMNHMLFLMCILMIHGVTLYVLPSSLKAQDVGPENLEFRRQAAKRMVFDQTQNIPLSGLVPSKLIGMDVMHPQVGERINTPQLAIVDGRLHISSEKKTKASWWVGGFSPFATYDVAVHKAGGFAEVGILLKDSKEENSISSALVMADGLYRSVRCKVLKAGKIVDDKDFPLEEKLSCDEAITIRIQILGVGVNFFIEQDKRSILVGRMDFVQYFDLRKKESMRKYEFCLQTELEANSYVEIDEATSFLSPGIGQSDLRIISYEDGSPFFKDERLWILFSARGGGLGHPIQGVLSMNPSLFDIHFEGIILFDRGDGLLRNDLASNIFYDRKEEVWRGFTTGFSAFGNSERLEEKQLWAVESKRMPLQGISIMSAKAIGLVGDYEDPQCIYDAESDVWRMILCENEQGYKAVLRESDQWDGPYKIIAGPVDENSTGTQLLKMGEQYYALFGSSDRKVYIRRYPGLEPLGELKIHLPPWNDKTGTRIWPNVIPLPDGYPAPFIALMMDRINYPGMTGANWTYGAMYLYHAFPAVQEERESAAER